MTESEKIVAKAIKKSMNGNDCEIITKGWPDFLVVKKTKSKTQTHPGRWGVAAVEVKSKNDTVKPHQKVVHDLLRMAGIPVYVLRPGDKINRKQALLFSAEDGASLQRDIDVLRKITEKTADFDYKYKNLMLEVKKTLGYLQNRLDHASQAFDVHPPIGPRFPKDSDPGWYRCLLQELSLERKEDVSMPLSWHGGSYI